MEAVSQTVDVLALVVPFFLLVGVFDIFLDWKNKTDRYSMPDSLASMACGLFNQLGKFLLIGFSFGAYQFVFTHFRLVTLQGGVIQWVLLFLAVDFLFYCYHRFSHRVRFFWAVHVVHHSSEYFNFTTSMRQSVFEFGYHYLFYLPLALMGCDLETFFVLKGLNSAYQLWQHTTVVDKLPGWFEWLMVTPSHHRVHHGRNSEYIDKNYGGVFILWDRLLGTFEPEVNPVRFGITKPLQSENPIVIQMHSFKELFQGIFTAQEAQSLDRR